MNRFEKLAPYLNDIESLVHVVGSGKGQYVEPALKNLGSVTIPIIREVISPAAIRNEDPEITDIAFDGVRRVRAVANKFKYAERSRGLQILRLFGAGGTMAQNRTSFDDKDPASKGYDLNTLVFGDSANRGNAVLPVKATAQYSDALSVSPYAASVDSTFHNRAAEDGTLYDAERNANSRNIFERHFVKPGTLFVQTISFNGRTAPIEAIRHLLLCVGVAGAYAGQTSIYGVNVRNHVVGAFAGRFERPVASPYELLRELGNVTGLQAAQVSDRVAEIFRGAYPTEVNSSTIAAEIAEMIAAVETGDTAMEKRYLAAKERVGAFFDSWFALSAR